MNDVEVKKEPVSTNLLAKRGVAAAAEIAGGALLLLMHGVGGGLRPLGIVLGLVIGGIGLSGLLSKDKDDKKPGAILAAAGALELVFQFGIPVLKGVAGTLLNVASFGLLALGIWNGIRFLKGLKSRKQG